MDTRQITEQRHVMVTPKEIDETPGPYCMSFGFDLNPLIRSIGEFGLLNPPIVTRNRDGRIDVVAGYRRILALKSLQWEKIPCNDLSDLGLSPLRLLHLNLYDNLATRKFNEVEKGMILNRLTGHIPKEQIIERYMPLVEIPSHESTLDIFLKLIDLDHPMKDSLVKGRISFKSITMLIELDQDSRSEVFGYLSKVKFNSNQQTQFIEYAVDISIREEKRISQLLQENPFLDILENRKLNNPQKAKLLLNLMRSSRFPTVVRSEKAFEERVSSLGLPQGVRVDHPPFFEGPDYRLEIFFKEGRELKEKINTLTRLNGLENLVDPWQDDS